MRSIAWGAAASLALVATAVPALADEHTSTGEGLVPREVEALLARS